MISVIRIYLLLVNSFNQSGPGVTIYRARKTFTESLVFSASKANTLRLKTNLAISQVKTSQIIATSKGKDQRYCL